MTRQGIPVAIGTFLVLMSLIWSATAVADEGAFRWPDLPSSVAVQEKAPQDVAVIVAIEDYAFLPPVPGAIRNGNDWETFFERGLGVDQVFMLTNRDATREAMLRLAREAGEVVGEEGTLWFLFIGHGAPLGGDDGGLVGMDASQTAESLRVRSVAQEELVAALESGRQARTVVAVDACFSGRGGDGATLVPGLQPVLPAEIQPSLRQTTVIFSAARSDQFAGPLPGQERPAFSYLLLGAMRGWAAAEGTGEVTASAALNYTRRQLRGLPDRQQTPELFGAAALILVRGVQEEDPQEVWRRAQIPAPVIDEEPEVVLAEEEKEEEAKDEDVEELQAVAAPADVEPVAAPFPVVPVALMAGGGLALGGAALTWFSAQPLKTDLESGTLTEVQGDDYVGRYNRRMVLSGSLVAVGVASLGAGATLLVLNRRGDGEMEVQATGTGVAVQWRF